MRCIVEHRLRLWWQTAGYRTKMPARSTSPMDMRDRLASALADRCPVVAASVDSEGQPHLSFFGTTQVHGPDQLAIGVRDPAAPFLDRIAGNPRVACT